MLKVIIASLYAGSVRGGGVCPIDFNSRNEQTSISSGRPPEMLQYRRSKARLIKLVQQINCKSLMDGAQQFNGLG